MRKPRPATRPDNVMCIYDYGAGRVLTYEMRVWTPYAMFNEAEDAARYLARPEYRKPWLLPRPEDV